MHKQHFTVLASVLMLLLAGGFASAQFGGGSGGKGLGGGFDLLEKTGADEAVEPGNEVQVSAAAQHAAVPRGGRTTIAMIYSHANGWKTWPASELDLIPADIAEFTIPTWTGVGEPVSVENYPAYMGPSVVAPGSVTGVSSVQWPATADIKNPLGGEPKYVQGFKGDSVALFSIEIGADAPLGEQVVPVGYYYQACDDTTCLMPVIGSVSVSLTVVEASGGYVASEPDAALFAGYQMPTSGWAAVEPVEVAGLDSSVESQADGDMDEAAGSGALGQGTVLGIPIPSEGASLLVAIIGLGVLGGFVLNLTPCVLPVIPLKVMTLSNHAGESKGRALYLGAWMFVGVTAFWSALSLPVIFLDQFADPSRLFGIWWFTLSIGVVVVLLALGLMGLFAINLPQKTYMINPKADNASGSFLYGVMTAILGLPCFGFIAGALVPAAAAQGPGFSVTLFTAMGVGMAAPYLVLAAFPGLLKFLPKTGPASELVKQVMGMLLLAAGAYFFVSGLNSLVKTYPYALVDAQWTSASLLAAFAGLWLMYRTFKITKKAPNRAVFGVIGGGISALSVLLGVSFLSDAREKYEEREAAIAELASQGGDGSQPQYFTTLWNDFSPALLESVKADNKIAVIDFTADWCINCKALKKAILDVEPVLSELKAEDTVMIKVDFTGQNAEGDALLKQFERVGIPTLAVLDGDGELVWVEGSYLSTQVLNAIDDARSREGL